MRFNLVRPMDFLPWSPGLASSRVTSPIYFYEGRLRGKSPHCLFQYSLSGEGAFFDARGVHRVPAGSGFLCKISDPETGYYYPKSASEPWVHIHVSFSGVDEEVRELVRRFGPVFRLDAHGPAMARLLDYERSGREPGTVLELTAGAAAGLVWGLVAALADSAAGGSSDAPGAWLVRKARQLVRAHIEEPFNVRQLAAALNVSHEHLCRVFRRETGGTPLRYLAREKARHACELLRESPLSCKEVCSRLGGDSASHFARTFRRATGLTPAEFRRIGAPPLF